MVIDKFNLVRTLFRPDETQAELVVDANEPDNRHTVRPALIDCYVSCRDTNVNGNVSVRDTLTKVQPRVCGEHMILHDAICTNAGSAPRVRGTLLQTDASGCKKRFSPACAGNTLPGKDCYYNSFSMSKIPPTFLTFYDGFSELLVTHPPAITSHIFRAVFSVPNQPKSEGSILQGS